VYSEVFSITPVEPSSNQAPSQLVQTPLQPIGQALYPFATLRADESTRGPLTDHLGKERVQAMRNLYLLPYIKRVVTNRVCALRLKRRITR